jgi:hypothetical protein
LSEAVRPWNTPRAFPLLGLTREAWRGPRRAALGAGTGIDGLRYRAHAYHLPGHRFPSVVIGVALRPAEPVAISADGALRWLLRAPGRPPVQEPAAVKKEPVEVDGGIAVAECAGWYEPRLSFLRFDWRYDQQVSVATWDHPLTAAFFRSLVVY